MINRLIKLILFLVIITFLIGVYLSFFGITTKKFNNNIEARVSNINKELSLELKTVKFLLNPVNLTINIWTINPKIFINNNQLELESIKTNISLRSFINNEFSIDDLQLSTKEIKLKDLIKLIRSFKDSAKLFLLDKVVKNGFLVGDINLNFDNSGNIKNDYEINGFLKNGQLSILKKNSIDDLNLIFNIKDKNFLLQDIEGIFNQIKLSAPSITITEEKDQFLVNGEFANKEKKIDTNIFINLFGTIFKKNEIENINFSSNNSFTFNLSKKFKISNFDMKSKVNLNSFTYKKDLSNIKKYFPGYKDTLKIENHEIYINYKKNKLDIKGKGKVFLENKADYISYEFKRKNDDYIFKTLTNIDKSSIYLEILNYKKEKNLNSTLKVNGSFKKNKDIKFQLISLKDNNNNFFEIKNLEMNEKFKIKTFDKLTFTFANDNKVKNQVSLIRNKKKYEVTGKSFDASKLLDQILNTDNDKQSSSLFSKLDNIFKVNIDKLYLDKITYLNNFAGDIKFVNNELDSLKLDSSFFNQKKLTLTVKTNDKKEKITTLFSGYPKPLVKHYKFIKGFEEGVLDFYSIKKDGVSNSVLNIDNFKVQEVPVLAKLLTLASLQGIADLLTGEGIRFTNLEVKFSNEKDLIKIKEMYAIGPAISILMDGYIEIKKLVSLRGTLVPATTINKSIASIPVIGKILVGKKTGEGVFGVSFKIKGSPNNLKTTVNPIKTLTPRFITRTLEKIK
tara:strand:- start:481 stop:2682 length:2202 start_codon:yes stop_codon:yes gene_type:complete